MFCMCISDGKEMVVRALLGHSGRLLLVFLQTADGGAGGAAAQSGRRRRKGRNDDELSADEEGVSATGTSEDEDEDDSDESGTRSRSQLLRFGRPSSLYLFRQALGVVGLRTARVPVFFLT